MPEPTRYMKLRNGDWGLKVPWKVRPGAKVTVFLRSGLTREEQVGIILWYGNGVSICTLKYPGKFKPGVFNGICAMCHGRVAKFLFEDNMGTVAHICSYCATHPRHERSFFV